MKVTAVTFKHHHLIDCHSLCFLAVKHSKSFAAANTDGGSMEELRETARRLTSDSNFRESVYKIIARKDGTNKTDD